MVMKSAEQRAGLDVSAPLNRAIGWRIFIQRTVGSDVVVIASIGSQYPAQMRLTQDHDMIQTLATD
jgi:hypothetical protein